MDAESTDACRPVPGVRVSSTARSSRSFNIVEMIFRCLAAAFIAGPLIADLSAGECVVTKPEPKLQDIVVMSKFGVQVFDQTGHSLEGVDVSVRDEKPPANQHVRVAKTDAHGYVLLPSLAAGDYSLEVYVPGFSPVRMQTRVATNDPSAVALVATRLYVSGECPTPGEACGVKGKPRPLAASPACLRKRTH